MREFRSAIPFATTRTCQFQARTNRCEAGDREHANFERADAGWADVDSAGRKRERDDEPEQIKSGGIGKATMGSA
jgi:hypothetical protein